MRPASCACAWTTAPCGVSDLPRRTGRLVSAMAVLDALGVRYETDPATGLWRLDWTAESWRDRLDRLPACLPALPREEALHPAYALCRLLLLHPARLKASPWRRCGKW